MESSENNVLWGASGSIERTHKENTFAYLSSNPESSNTGDSLMGPFILQTIEDIV